MIVADTNLIVYLLIEGEHTELARQVLERDSHWVAPLLWRSEFRNVVALYLRAGEVEFEGSLRLLARAEILMRGREYAVASAEVMRLVHGSERSAYDCEFVALATQLGIPLVTFDRRVRASFPDATIQPEAFVA